MTGDWRDLSDAELSARLRHRGVDPARARIYVKERDSEEGEQVLDDLLGDR